MGCCFRGFRVQAGEGTGFEGLGTNVFHKLYHWGPQGLWTRALMKALIIPI